MKRFLAECGLFLALQGVVFLALEHAYRNPYVTQGFLAAWIDKLARLEATPPPRVILVGGSNLAFGVDSPALERQLRWPVVNLGLNAGLGRELILRPAEAAVRSGDVVVLSLEYDLFLPREWQSASTILKLLDAAPSAARYVPARQWPALLDHGLNHLALRPQALLHAWWSGRRDGDPVYARKAFNRRGDAVAHRTRHGWLPPDRHVILPFEPSGARVAVARVELFAARVRAAGARVFITTAPIPEDDLAAQAERFAGFWELFASVPNVQRLELRPVAFPRAEFYDTAYHLGAEATRKRTDHLFAALRRALPPHAEASGRN